MRGEGLGYPLSFFGLVYLVGEPSPQKRVRKGTKLGDLVNVCALPIEVDWPNKSELLFSLAQRPRNKRFTFWGHDFLKRRIRMTPQASDIPSGGLEPDTTSAHHKTRTPDPWAAKSLPGTQCTGLQNCTKRRRSHTTPGAAEETPATTGSKLAHIRTTRSEPC